MQYYLLVARFMQFRNRFQVWETKMVSGWRAESPPQYLHRPIVFCYACLPALLLQAFIWIHSLLGSAHSQGTSGTRHTFATDDASAHFIIHYQVFEIRFHFPLLLPPLSPLPSPPSIRICKYFCSSCPFRTRMTFPAFLKLKEPRVQLPFLTYRCKIDLIHVQGGAVERSPGLG